MTQFQELQEPNKYWGSLGYRTGSPSLCNMVTARQAAADTGGFVGIKCQPGQSPSTCPESVLCHQPGAKQMPVISTRNTGHTAALAVPWGKAITDRLYPLRLTQRCPGSDQVGHAGGGGEPPVSSEAAGDGEDADVAGLQAPGSRPAAGGAQQVQQQAEEDGAAGSQEDDPAGEHAGQRPCGAELHAGGGEDGEHHPADQQHQGAQQQHQAVREASALEELDLIPAADAVHVLDRRAQQLLQQHEQGQQAECGAHGEPPLSGPAAGAVQQDDAPNPTGQDQHHGHPIAQDGLLGVLEPPELHMLFQDIPLDVVRIRRGAGAAQLCQLWHGGQLGEEGTEVVQMSLHPYSKWRVNAAAVVKAAAFLQQ